MQAFGTSLLRSGERQRQAGRNWWIWFCLVLALTVAIGITLLLAGPELVSLAWILYFAGMVAILIQPRYGLYLIVFLTLVDDQTLMPWFPFIKNFSSSESAFYIQGHQLIFSPLETYLVLTLLSWLVGALLRHRLDFRRGPLFGAAVVFTVFMLFGLGWGLLRGGNVTIALWEIRPILYLPLVLVLASNLIETQDHVNRLIWLAMSALFIVAVVGIWYYSTVLGGVASRIESLIEHGAAVRLDTLFVLTLAVFLYGASRAKRIILPLMLPFALFTYIVAQRRAAMLSLGVALILILILLYQQNRRAFWRIAPPVLLISLVYLVAFWNNQGTLGLPARAVRSVLSVTSGNFQEDASTYYRTVENVNINYTIHQAPLTGVGFGHQFQIIVPLPDISFFTWWQYITHNSIVWIWMESGVGGFLSAVFLVGMAVVTGVRVLRRMPGKDMSAIALTATLYVVMHFLYAYVDMSWDIQSMVYMGLMMGLINSLLTISGAQGPLAAEAAGRASAPSGRERP
jgi:hypothetical protein